MFQGGNRQTIRRNRHVAALIQINGAIQVKCIPSIAFGVIPPPNGMFYADNWNGASQIWE